MSTPFVIERTFNAPIAKVWNAITNNDEMKKWYFELPEFKAEEGFEFQFYGGKGDQQWLHLCKVTDVVSGKKLTHSWRYDGMEGNTFVTWELFEEGDKTRLKLTHEGLETLPQNEFFKKENFANGWTQILDQSLAKYLGN